MSLQKIILQKFKNNILIMGKNILYPLNIVQNINLCAIVQWKGNFSLQDIPYLGIKDIFHPSIVLIFIPKN